MDDRRGAFTDTAANVEAQGDAIVVQAEDAQIEQTSLLETLPLESQYSLLVATYVEAKHDQVERLEERLENLIEQQVAGLQQDQSIRGIGLFLRPGKRAVLQESIAKKQAVIQRLCTRLDTVREIKEGMGLYSSRIEELAIRKLRAKEPDLAAEWDEQRNVLRHCLTLQRKQEQKTHERGQSRSLSRVHPVD